MQKKLFFTYVVIIIFLSSIIGFYSVSICQGYYTNDYKEHLIKESALLSDLLEKYYEKNGYEGFEAFTEIYGQKLNIRITIIDKQGKVWGDSKTDAAFLENHKNRTEIITAINGKIGIDSRYSQTLKTEYLYVAMPVEFSGEFLVLRLAVPLLALTNIKNQVLLYVFMGIFAAAVVSFLCAYYVTKKIAAPLDYLTEAANEIAQGNFGKKIPIEKNDQIGILTRAFNKMSLRLNTTVHQLENENMKLESIVNSMLNAVVAVDNENKILMINSECYKLFQIKINNIIGYHFYDIIRNESVYKLLEASMKGKKHCMDEMIFKSPYDGDKIMRVYANPIIRPDNGPDVKGSLLVFQDITQIRKLEQLRSDFVSNVTHELKTPLTSILGFTDTLKSGAIYEPKTALHFIDIIEIESKRLYRLILDILSLSEIETRNQDINLQKEDLGQMLYCVCEMLQSQADIKGLKMIIQIDKNIPLFQCNKDRISQMMINLVDNAIKYTEKGAIYIRCGKYENTIKISVEDTGIGIPEECLDRIFERFYRVDKGRSRKAGGTGLGLSIVKHIAMLYEGKLNVLSKEGEGSIFEITFPL